MGTIASIEVMYVHKTLSKILTSNTPFIFEVKYIRRTANKSWILLIEEISKKCFCQVVNHGNDLIYSEFINKD